MYSFDIFDTLITRRTATPEGIFLLMQENMKKGGRFDPYLTANFYEVGEIKMRGKWQIM